MRCSATLALLTLAAALLVTPTLALDAQSSLDNALCPVCEQAVLDIEKSLASNATEAEVVAALSELCKLFPEGSTKRAACVKEFSGLGKVLNSTDESILVKYTPRSLCGWPRLCSVPCCGTPETPEQIHIALGDNPGEMRVTWVTLEDMPGLTCKWGLASNNGVLDHSAPGVSNTYLNGGWVGYVHTCVMDGLAPATRYAYTVGSPQHSEWDHPNWALPKGLSFVTPPSPGSLAPNDTTTFAQIADMGAMDASDLTVARLTARVLNNELDFLLVSGDQGYADGVETIWDDYARKVEIIAARIPYQTLKGNHADFYDGIPLYTRYPGPSAGWTRGGPDAMYYSWVWGHVRVIALDSENDFGLAPDLTPGGSQYLWLEATLAAANTPAARALQPWVIVTMHRPMYCTSHTNDCDTLAPLFRDSLEPLFVKYGVDLHISGHRHSYTRTTPVLRTKVQPPGSAPTYIVCGVGGSKEGPSGGFPASPPPWAVFFSETFGYLRVQATATTLTTFYHAALTDDVLDTVHLYR